MRCCPRLTLVGFYGGTGLAGDLNPFYTQPNTPDRSYQLVGQLSERLQQLFARLSCRLNLAVPIRNRVAKADQYRSELEYRQAELREQQLKKQIRIEVRNAEYALEQGRARVEAAKKARDLADKTFGIMQKEQTAGRGIELPDADRATRSGAGATRSGECQHGVSEIEARIAASHGHDPGRE